MIDTSEFELDRELEQLSGWKEVDMEYWNPTDIWEKRIPHYDLGYLLRKLPKRLDTQRKGGVADIPRLDWHSLCIIWEYQIEKWRAGYKDNLDDYWIPTKAIADTPKNALCLLAIALFEQGILEREK